MRVEACFFFLNTIFCSDILLDMKPALIFPALAEAHTFVTPGPSHNLCVPLRHAAGEQLIKLINKAAAEGDVVANNWGFKMTYPTEMEI